MRPERISCSGVQEESSLEETGGLACEMDPGGSRRVR